MYGVKPKATWKAIVCKDVKSAFNNGLYIGSQLMEKVNKWLLD